MVNWEVPPSLPTIMLTKFMALSQSFLELTISTTTMVTHILLLPVGLDGMCMISFASDLILVLKPHLTLQPKVLDQCPFVGTSQSGPSVLKEVLKVFCWWYHLHSNYLQAIYALPYATNDAFTGNSEVHCSIFWEDAIKRVCRLNFVPKHIVKL